MGMHRRLLGVVWPGLCKGSKSRLLFKVAPQAIFESGLKTLSFSFLSPKSNKSKLEITIISFGVRQTCKIDQGSR